jgi:hypothetical protein
MFGVKRVGGLIDADPLIRLEDNRKTLLGPAATHIDFIAIASD